MGTQATLTLLRDGKVVRKIVAGCNGDGMEALRDRLENDPTDDLGKLIEHCIGLSVGCPRCLLIQSSPDKITTLIQKDVDDFSPGEYTRWRETFYNPTFNPRWDNGTASYSLVLDLDLCTKHQPKSK